jgi:hypothetical protein
MELIQVKCQENCIYKLEFLEKVGNRLLTIRVMFKEDWRFNNKDKELFSDFGVVTMGCFERGPRFDFPYDPKEKLNSIPLHIPHEYGRKIFKLCMDKFIEETSAPMHTAFVPHPGYPLLMVTFDTDIMPGNIVTRLIDSIYDGIYLAETETQLIETEDQATADDVLDEVDENVVVEFDFDEDLKRVMKEPVSTLVQSIGGGMEDA